MSLSQLIITDQNTGKQVGVIDTKAKDFKTGSKGYFCWGKISDPEDPNKKYQISGNAVLIGSKNGSK